ncbi:MAG: hypothetical protein LPK47_05680, partial [Bacteroidota bacterium]|nr:hypothetical protein [Bacteroidota bacterium]
MKRKISFLAAFFFVALAGQAKDIPYLPKAQNNGSNNGTLKTVEELCSPARAESDLNINNVRAKILAGGDMWWDLNQARYEVPKGSNKHAMFAGALWLGGVDEGNQLKLAAMTYRQRGNDYWPGPLSNDGLASVTKDICDKYDQHWILTREEVEIHAAWIECKNDPNCDVAERFPDYSEATIPESIQEWPGDGIDGEVPRLAPYIDVDGSGDYDPVEDYPAYDLKKEFDCTLKETDILYGDQTIWWVYNDRGNIHTETNAGALGFEIRAQAFAFATNDEVNNMTFNNYRIINKSTFRLTNTYFSTWFDPDLGNARDDIIGCDIPRGLGYVYNADNNDEGALGYGLNPPAVGFDFFQGPFADYFDGRDNDRDGCVDGVRDINGNCIAENPATGVNERIIMSGFMYYNNTGSATSGNPNNAGEFYNYMRSRWKNGFPLVVENPSGPGNTGNGDGFTPTGTGDVTLFAYPGETYDTTETTPPVAPLIPGWYESPNNQEDKRGLHNAGPFSLAPGALNFITTGVVWERDINSSDLFASVEKVIIADDKAQELFDNCFRVLDGPDAPDMTIVELDQELILNLGYQPSSNNFNFSYRERDPLITIPPGGDFDSIINVRPNYFEYVFEGFQIYQLATEQVSVSDLNDPTQARLVAQCDVKNGITQLVNYEVDPDINRLVPENMTPVYNNQGIVTSFRFTEDAFATNNRRLINHKPYHFLVIAYAYNEYEPFDPQNSPNGQRKPYLAGRRNIRVTSAIPHKTLPENGGMVLGANYGDSPEITRIEGVGNGNNFLRLTEGTVTEILNNVNDGYLTYQRGAGPLDLKVVDPKRVPSATYTIEFTGTTDDARWNLVNAAGEIVDSAIAPIGYLQEQILYDKGQPIGLSLRVNQVRFPGNDSDNVRNNGFIGAERVFSNPTNSWLSGVSDADSYTPLNWILSGGNTTPTEQPAESYPDFGGDPRGVYKTILGGTWAPGTYLSPIRRKTESPYEIYGMGPADPLGRIDIERVHDVDVIFTSDPSKWTRVPVLEMAEDPSLSVDGNQKFQLRKAAGLQQDPANPRNLIPDPANPGWSVFPGYAIDVATGKRLNMFFGENTWLKEDNGNDMRWNPSSRIVRTPADNVTGGYVMGGQ